MSVIDTLKERGFFHQCTDEASLRKRLDEGPITFYAGFDPSADSLHAGHLVQLMLMAHLARAGNTALAVVGGGTMMVGDPTGKEEARDLLPAERIAQNKEKLKKQIERFCPGELLDNAEWLLQLNYITFLRDIGRHFSVNRMVKADSVKMRLERDQGLSFLEFNYPLLQGYDFLELYRRRGCRLQVGGADQWFNIISGTDLIRRIEGVEAWGLTSPLLLNASGQKMGKTASGAVWLDADKLKPYDYAQYWYNCDDRDVEKLLKLFTFLPLEQIAEVMQGDIRAAKRVLADEATAIVHPHVDIPEFPTVFPTTVIAVMVGANLAKSKSDARRLIEQGGVSTPEGKVTSFDAVLAGPTELKVGKKHTIRVVAGSVVG